MLLAKSQAFQEKIARAMYRTTLNDIMNTFALRSDEYVFYIESSRNDQGCVGNSQGRKRAIGRYKFSVLVDFVKK